jgi:hypothetical protein
MKMELDVFDMYFASLVSMAMHPGYNRDNVTQPTMEECAEQAQEMIEIRHKYVKQPSGEL